MLNLSKTSPYLASRQLFAVMMAVFVCLGVVVSLLEILRPWVVGVWLVSSISIILAGLMGKKTLLTLWMRVVLAFLLIFFEIYWDSLENWQLVLAQTLVILLSIKLLELKGLRDAYQVAGLSLLALGIASFLRVDLTLAFLILWVIVGDIAMLLWMQLIEACEAKKRHINTGLLGWLGLFSVFFCLVMLPLTLFFFFLLPRTPAPMWTWAPEQRLVSSGFNPEMSPSSVGKIVMDKSVAFRAQIEPKPSNPEALYWTGAVLWKMQGENWLPQSPEPCRDKPAAKNISPPFIKQTIVLPPISEGYLFSLPFPIELKGIRDVRFNKDGTIKLAHAQRLPIRYEVVSAKTQPFAITPSEKALSLELPENLHPGIHELATALKKDAGSLEEVAMKTRSFLSSAPFSYSLSAPKGYENGQKLEDFLLKTHTGYCELYASALALLLRLNGIPARVVVGYNGAEYNPVGDYWLVRQSMAHAWTEAWVAEKGWVRMDATPASLMAEQVTDGQNRQESGRFANTMTRYQRAWDWLQWQWQNLIIDLTPAKQRQIWLETGKNIGRVMSWDFMHVQWKKIKKIKTETEALLFVSAIGLTFVCFAVLLFFLRKTKLDTHYHQNKFRKRAAHRLQASVKGCPSLKMPGREQHYWKSLEITVPNRLEAIKKAYYAQRYGQKPSKQGDDELKKLLSNLKTQE